MIMKKIFTLLVMSVMAVAVNADITIYVKADVAPYIWAWNASGNVFTDAWPGTDTDLSEWRYTRRERSGYGSENRQFGA